MQVAQEMELILNRDEEQIFMQFQTDWLGKWVPAIVTYAQKRKKVLSSTLDGRYTYCTEVAKIM